MSLETGEYTKKYIDAETLTGRRRGRRTLRPGDQLRHRPDSGASFPGVMRENGERPVIAPGRLFEKACEVL